MALLLGALLITLVPWANQSQRPPLKSIVTPRGTRGPILEQEVRVLPTTVPVRDCGRCEARVLRGFSGAFSRKILSARRSEGHY
jgi:hypothetical protein